MSNTTRRVFMMQVAAGSAALAATQARAQAKVEESDPQAKALDYKVDWHQGRHEEIPEAHPG